MAEDHQDPQARSSKKYSGGGGTSGHTHTHRHTNTQTDIATYKLNRPRGRFCRNLISVIFICIQSSGCAAFAGISSGFCSSNMVNYGELW